LFFALSRWRRIHGDPLGAGCVPGLDRLLDAGDIHGCGSLDCAPLQLLNDVARIVDDAEPAVVGAVGDGVILGAGVGKNEVVGTPICADASSFCSGASCPNVGTPNATIMPKATMTTLRVESALLAFMVCSSG